MEFKYNKEFIEDLLRRLDGFNSWLMEAGRLGYRFELTVEEVEQEGKPPVVQLRAKLLLG
jgi:hypothetical protein